MKPQIKTFEDACAALGIKADLPVLPSFLKEERKKGLTAHYKLTVIAEALNEGWQPNWNNSDEWKYYPWFWIQADKDTPSGSGLSYYDCDCTGSSAFVGSRLCFKTRELARYAGEQFTEIYKEYLLFSE